ncbi:Nramp family divalent metal transporter [Bdellovibrio sp. KM01]|uniref:Nramp family divalent metal transporter n=1 Tax=Bdellovibrio sp. KM01 TaxID=2748865 RepID=UPI0015E9EE13|nr:Nramp family divalent metal transporter [Bdellovibrio sp. KM01]QLY26535.1 Nramp family divalent metal transporter [Bdellovibrio sp. KM01]
MNVELPKRKFTQFIGPGVLVAVGYMDPGNWATDLEAGSRFGFNLLCVILFSSVAAMLLQSICVRVGVVTGKDLAELCRDQYRPWVKNILWVLAEIAIIATDIAEVLGTALAFNMILGVWVENGILLTAFNMVFIFILQGKGMRRIEAIVLAFVLMILLCFVVQVFLSSPPWWEVLNGYIPKPSSFNTAHAWYVAIGIMGATVMPHNLYLHTAVVQSRVIKDTPAELKYSIRMITWEVILSLAIAFFINSAILIVSASVFHLNHYYEITEIQDAYKLLSPLLGASAASFLFALALFAAGQSSTITGAIAGQVILEGFMHFHMPVWIRRAIARVLAIIPAWIGVHYMGEHAVGRLLVGTQVILSLQLPFAVVPLLMFACSKTLMKDWALSAKFKAAGWSICAIIIAANVYMLMRLIQE